MRSPKVQAAIRVGVSVSVLVILALTLELEEVVRQLREVRLPWVGLALLASVAQVALSAWRWRFTAERIGLRLPFSEAFREYYLATFLNQVLPGGVLGDVSRAWRQARDRGPGPSGEESGSRGSAARAVILERASGQIVMLATAALCAVILASGSELSGIEWVGGAEVGSAEVGFADGGSRGASEGLIGGLAAGALLLGMVGAVTARRRMPGRGIGAAWRWMGRVLGRGWSETRRSLLSPGPFLVQAMTSMLVVGSYVLVFILAARAVGVETPTPLLALLIPPALVAMLIPISLAGWGLREGAAALLWASVGLSAAEGTAASVMYGLLVLASSLPGAVIFLELVLRGEESREPPSGPPQVEVE